MQKRRTKKKKERRKKRKKRKDILFNDTETTEIYTLSLQDALPICAQMTNTGAISASTQTGPYSPRRREMDEKGKRNLNSQISLY